MMGAAAGAGVGVLTGVFGAMAGVKGGGAAGKAVGDYFAKRQAKKRAQRVEKSYGIISLIINVNDTCSRRAIKFQRVRIQLQNGAGRYVFGNVRSIRNPISKSQLKGNSSLNLP